MKRFVFCYILPVTTSILFAYSVYQLLLTTDVIKHNVSLEIELESFQSCDLQIYAEEGNEFRAEQMQSQAIPENNGLHWVTFTLPDLKSAGRIRIDPGLTTGTWRIKKILLRGLNTNLEFDAGKIIENFKATHDVQLFELKDEFVYLVSSGSDPNFTSNFRISDYLTLLTEEPTWYPFPFLLSICFGFFLFYLLLKKLRPFATHTPTHDQVLIFCFLIIISGPCLIMNLAPKKNNESGENRILRSKPVFDIARIKEYPGLFNSYFEDNFGLKKTYTTVDSYLRYKLFHASSKPALVAIGKESWLFSTDPNTSGDYRNITLFTPTELRKIKTNLEQISLYHKKRDIHFYLLVLPVKSSIYPEYLPSILKIRKKESKLCQVREHLEKENGFQLIDVSNELIQEKKRTEVYYKYDVHWNYEGAFLGYKKLIQKMSLDYPELQARQVSDYYKKLRYSPTADLSKQLALEHVLLKKEWYYESRASTSFQTVKGELYPSTLASMPTICTQIKNSKLPKALVYRDSFFNLMIPFFSEHFSDCVYIWSNTMAPDVLEKERPQFVVYEITERYIDKLLEDNPSWIKDTLQP